MTAIAHSPEFAKKAGVPMSVGKDFTKADLIRQSLLAQGIVLEDKPGGITEWRRA